ncbi:MAG: 3'(2'),5'-bisphosphate nucleotidase CysQ, partial [Gammaproteobacteria bacterium]|nr:3'(2'),5'-bisphosphate nucleotidase CysQ [Gammaproteobacteria bacterium]
MLAPDLKLDTLLEQTSSLANLAGARILEVYETDFAVQSKEDDSPLTAADLAAHQCIKEGLAELTPELPLLSEESRALPWPVRSSWRTYWLVDPLDGTKEFVKRN